MKTEANPKRRGKVAVNRWPYLLRILLKAGYTPEGLAHAAFTTEARIRDFLSGKRIPEYSTAKTLGSILTSHKRRDGLRVARHTGDAVRPPEPEAPRPAPLARDVYEDPSPPEGYRQFRAIAEDGTELISLRYHWRAEERDVVPGLRAWLNRADPIIRLLESDASTQSS